MLSKFIKKYAQKLLIFPIKASFEKSLFFLLLLGCNTIAPDSNSKWHTIAGRDAEELPLVRLPIYRAKIAQEWIHVEPRSELSIIDTTKPLCEYWVNEGDGQQIRVTIHNFPLMEISPASQIFRWQGQFDTIETETVQILQQSFNGFLGFYLEATGVMKGSKTSLMGWAMQPASIHRESLRSLMQQVSGRKLEWVQMEAPWTIKATGPPHLLEKYKHAIIEFARSFEWIEEV